MNDSRIARRGDSTEKRIAQRCVRIAEIDAIDHVEELAAKLDPVAFKGHRKTFEQRSVDVYRGWSSSRVAPEVAEGSFRTCRVRGGIEPFENTFPARPAVVEVMIPDDIRTIAAYTRQGVVETRRDIEWSARLNGEDTVSLPAA